MGFTPMRISRAAAVGLSLLALAGCENGLDFDLRGYAGGFTTADAALNARTAARPEPDARGVISYPTYQVAVAREGETIAQMAARLGLGANELGRYNGIPPETTLRTGEIIALPRRVDGAAGSTESGTIDVTALATTALDRVGETTTTAAAATEQEPIRHQVQRGETAYSISRLYNVSVRALADWNGLDSALTVREGQYLLIPVMLQETAAGTGAVTSTPLAATGTAATAPAATTTQPSAAPVAAAPVAQPAARMAMPVDGTISRPYEQGKTDGIDITAPAGTPVRAAAEGTVAAITRNTEQVPILVLRHAGNILTVYAGIDNIQVEKGDKVTRGQVIASVRAANPAFLHFQVREGTMSVDPMDYLK